MTVPTHLTEGVILIAGIYGHYYGNREVNSSVVSAMAMIAMILRLRDAHKERQLNFQIHFLFLTFIVATSR